MKEEADIWGKRRKLVNSMLEAPELFSKADLSYVSKRLPFDGEDEGICAFFWAKAIGHRDRMAKIVKKKAPVEYRVRFAFDIDTYKQEMKETISYAKEAYFWAKAFPGDAEEFIDFVQGGKWAYKWAKEIGDEEKMKSRLSTTYWKTMFDKEIEEDDGASFVSARG